MIPAALERCSIHEAEYVEYPKGHVEKILSKYGIGFCCPLCGAVSYNVNDLENNYCGACHEFTEAGAVQFAPPSKGGFGCETELGCVTMWQAVKYWRRERAKR